MWQNSDKRKSTELMCVVHAIADDEGRWTRKADKIGMLGRRLSVGFVQQNADFHSGCATLQHVAAVQAQRCHMG